jgi:hypothetical protein
MEDDMFLDDDLDDIPDNTLLELEQNAISSTQKQKSSQPPPPAVNLRKQAHNASSLYRSQKATNNIAWRPPRRQQPGVSAASQARPAVPNQTGPPSSDEYGFDEENVIDLDEPSMVIHPASGPPTKPFARPTSRTASRSVDPETISAFAAADAEMGAGAQQWAHAPHLQHKPRSDSETSKLMARIAQLEAEQTRLQRLEQEARRAAATKQGEISIVRAKEEKAANEYERRLSAMQKLHADETAKQKAELEAMRKQREKMEIDNRFLQHDLAQEADKVKRTSGPSKLKQTKERNTPRKKRQGHGDGFNDSEVLMISPSRSRERSKDQTPTAGAKRKRSAQDSPVPALSFMPPLKPSRETSGEQLATTEIISNANTSSNDAREQYEFVQRMLSHKQPGCRDRTIELFTKHSFPSNPARSLASILLDGLSSPMQDKSGTHHMPLKASYTLLGLWSSCLHQKTYEPLALIIDMLRAALYFELSAQVSKLVEEAVPICLQTIDLVVTPVIQSQHASFSATFDHSAQEDLALKVDVDEVVEFLYFINQSAALDPGRLETFWQHIHFKGSLLMLNKVQPLPRIVQALQILSTSILDSTFGAISHDTTQQEQQEQTTVDRLATWLFETPRAPKDEPCYTEEELAGLRIETLNIFRRMCLTDHGGQLLAKHRFAIAKLVKFLHGQVGKLYKIRPHACRRRHSSSSDGDDQPTLHDLTIANINTTVRVLHHILRTFDESIDLTSKLEVERGGYHAFLISMSRVAFSEQLVFEAGIETEVVEAAHDILDNVLSPEEGEAIVKAVETPRGTRSTTTRRNPSRDSQEDKMLIDNEEDDHGGDDE